MPVETRSMPRLIFFKKEGAKTEFKSFSEAFRSFMAGTFRVSKEETLFDTAYYMPPDRDNQFVAGHVRSVYHRYVLEDRKEFLVQDHDEESADESFNAPFLYSFYSLSFYFAAGDDWPHIDLCWRSLLPFMNSQGFYDATLSYTFDGGLYAHLKRRKETAGMAEFVVRTEREYVRRFADDLRFHVELQHKPYLDIGRLLGTHPSKDSVKSLQINHNGLTDWPDAVFEFTNLEEIDIYDNPMARGDSRFLGLRKLRTINCNETPLSKSPAELARWIARLPPDCRLVFY